MGKRKSNKKSSSSSTTGVVAAGTIPPPPLESTDQKGGTKLSTKKRKIASLSTRKTSTKKRKIRRKTSTKKRKIASLAIHYYQRFGRMRCLPEGSKTLYATNIYNPEDRKLVPDDFVEFFRDVGKVVNVEIQFNPKCAEFVDFAKIEFESHDVAKKAMEEKQSCCFYYCGFMTLNGLPKFKDPGYKKKDFTDERLVIYVTGLGHKLRSELKDFFSVCGELDWVTTPMNDNNNFSKGHAFIEFKNEENFKKALSLEGTLFLGSPLKVGRAKVFVTSV